MNTPLFLYGTAWKENETQRCVSDALKLGFRGIDTANQRKHYFEAAVGNAVQESRIPRGELFLQTKFTFQRGQDHRLPYDPSAPIEAQVRQSLASSLEHLHTEYVDSYVLHGPTAPDGERLMAEDWEAWRAMESLQKQNKIRHLGVSNVTLSQLKELSEGAELKPKFVQIRCYAQKGWARDIRAYCRETEMTFQGFSLLTGNKDVVNGRALKEMAERFKVTPAQIVFAFARQMKMLPLTGTTDPVHMRQDLDSRSIALEVDDLRVIERAGE